MSKYITNWEPENKDFWQKQGKKIATRNLWISVPALLLAFVVWSLWSVVVIYLPKLGFNYDSNQLMLLTALPALSGATLRIFYAFMVPIFGGRKWTFFSTALTIIPLVWFGICVQNPETSFTTMAIIALLCGFGGGNFSSSMANIGYFFPKTEKGYATGVNAGLGNLGVSVLQFAAPLVIGVGIFGSFGGDPKTIVQHGHETSIWLQNIGFIWIPMIVLALVFIWFGMNDLASAKASFSEQSAIFKRKDNWLLCWLYLGMFGSFIGYSAVFPIFVKHSFPDIDPLTYAFLGPLLGSIFRVVGGMISDKIRPTIVTQISYVGVIIFTVAVLYFIPQNGQPGHFMGFFISFMLIFVFVGLGNGSVFAQTPVVFARFHRKLAASTNMNAEDSAKIAVKETGAVLGFMGAIGAYGGFIIPKFCGTAVAYTGSFNLAFYCFIAFYCTCLLVNWWFYLRKSATSAC
ncbi:NarK family nitrate/nitrite MFS transporter [Commensalibacter papalotli (ex Botero et al. 2024)]|uniref:Nitrate/nitrite transporter n=1 Tax=Commensalibacter papalotli (ex Botero et al. 2024) TaxID=2972766 RepID=A0ABN8WCY1_9PROT|nr:NarK family nitrate/nitrite MFS transporter [Commensalibacter papalotli (ex Botero et al. 2024)]CAI3943629.1 Nitrate/nitrite transporter NarK (NarK) (PDB:4JR9) [Commensalibacter papalotli (ex Botero et al. 2024)]CAI3947266.1 Nitrate/nitrite transporter NarK (NarK) (PDB:4JR9) [Commensalibacter papalotli (ex Botero et al. 2024)]